MLIDRMIYPIESLGPGQRLVIWTVGCSKHCLKCANPELWQSNLDKNISLARIQTCIEEICQKQQVDGITFTGGDPLEQYSQLAVLLPLIRPLTDDILIYTGYTLTEAESAIPADMWSAIRANTDVLIDGRYVESLNTSSCVLRGSANQVIHYFNADAQDRYIDYMSKGRIIQNVFYGDRLISTGIHNRGN